MLNFAYSSFASSNSLKQCEDTKKAKIIIYSKKKVHRFDNFVLTNGIALQYHENYAYFNFSCWNVTKKLTLHFFSLYIFFWTIETVSILDQASQGIIWGPLKLTLFIEEAQMYLCFNKRWRLVPSVSHI